MNISGINSLVFYRTEHKRILLLGEVHSLEGECAPKTKNSVRVATYLKRLLKIPNGECLDIFLEGSYKIPIISRHSNLAKNISKLSFVKLNNLRIHHTDPRVIISEGRKYSPFAVMIILLLESKNYEDVLSEEDLIKTLDYLLTINRKENRKYFLKLIRAFSTDPKVMRLFRFWEASYFKIITKELKKLDKTTMTRKKLLTNLSEVYHENIREGTYQTKNKLVDLMLTLIALPIDLYNLSRMFIKFNKKRDSTCNKLTVDNIIIYTGSIHTQIYEKFFNRVFNTTPLIKSVNQSHADLCLPVPKFNFWEK